MSFATLSLNLYRVPGRRPSTRSLRKVESKLLEYVTQPPLFMLNCRVKYLKGLLPSELTLHKISTERVDTEESGIGDIKGAFGASESQNNHRYIQREALLEPLHKITAPQPIFPFNNGTHLRNFILLDRINEILCSLLGRYVVKKKLVG